MHGAKVKILYMDVLEYY